MSDSFSRKLCVLKATTVSEITDATAFLICAMSSCVSSRPVGQSSRLVLRAHLVVRVGFPVRVLAQDRDDAPAVPTSRLRG